MSWRVLLRGVGGGTAVEFALAAPILAAVILGLFQVGMALHSGAAVRNAVQRASRGLLVDRDASASALRSAAIARLPAVPVDALSFEVTAETLPGGLAARRVAWRYSYPVSIPFLPDQIFVFDSALVVPVPSS